MVLTEFGIDDPLGRAVHIPQKGGGAAALAVLNGTATFLCANSSSLAGFVANGQLKPILVTTLEPVTGFDAPTAADLGRPILAKLVGWTGVAGPRGLPDEIARKWEQWVGAASADPEFRKKMAARGSIIRFMDETEANRFILDQYATFRTLVDELGMRIEN
jgi:tripartite-type tricarboxylate transporter receptor subunit TctC